MSVLAPPPAPPSLGYSDFAQRRFRMRLIKTLVSLVTVLVSGWLFTLGTIPGILGLLVAKHVLIAVFLMGSGIHDPRLMPGPKES